MSHVWTILQPFQWERVLRQYLLDSIFPGSKAPEIPFAPKCNMSHQLQLHNFYHTGQFIPSSLQLLLCISTAELNFLPFISHIKFSIHFNIVTCLEWDYLKSRTCWESWAAQLRAFQGRREYYSLIFAASVPVSHSQYGVCPLLKNDFFSDMHLLSMMSY